MSKYYKAEDILAIFDIEERPLNWTDSEAEIQAENDFDYYKGAIESLPTIEVSEEDELKFCYVESIDDYWIGQRLDNFYYAKWNSKLGFVWSASRYLPWGEHIVNENTLWKEHTYPSEPREIPFTEWIVGFMKKYGSEVSEDCISREDAVNALIAHFIPQTYTGEEVEQASNLARKIMANAQSVIPKRSCYRCGLREDCEDSTERKPKQGVWIDKGYYAVCSNCGAKSGTQFNGVEPIPLKTKFCGNCGLRMKGADDE